MSHHRPSSISAQRTLTVYAATEFCATQGVNQLETLADPETLVLGDDYSLTHGAQPETFALDAKTEPSGAERLILTHPTRAEPRGARMRIEASLSFVSHSGVSREVVVLTTAGPTPRRYVHPVDPLETNTDYTLIAVSKAPDTLPKSGIAGLSFARGTRLTTATGAQVPVENLAPGDRILTRDNGMQPIRWMSRRTVQAVGALAPVVIAHGALGNAEALVVSQSHLMMVTDWRAEVLTGAKDVLISAADLVNGDDICLRSGGFVEYTQIVFDAHQIIYAEGVATGSLHVSPDILSQIADEDRAALLEAFPALLSQDTPTARIALDHEAAHIFLTQTGRRPLARGDS